MIQSVDRTSQIVLKSNPNYWGPKPVYNSVILHDAPPATQAFDIQDGQAQLALDISPQAAASLSSSVNVISYTSPDQLYLIMNASPKVLPWAGDQNFRDAVRYGIDYQGLVALAGKGAAQATGFIPNGFLGSLPAVDAPQRDLARAKAALAKVGAANPTITLAYATDATVDGLSIAPFAIKVQSDLKEVGITANLAGAPKAVLDAKFLAGQVQVEIATNNADYPDPADFTSFDVVGGGGDTQSDHWVPGMDPAIDALTATALSATTAADRGSAYQALEKAMNDKAYFDFILQPGRTLIAGKSVHATGNPFTYVDFGSVT